MSQHHKRSQPDESEESVLPDVEESFETEEDPEAIARQRIVDEIKETADKLHRDKATLGDLKILSRALRELRYAFKVFKPFRRNRKITVFGSARTPPDDLNYQLTVEYGRRMAQEGWYVVTGAGGGIMEAAHVGAGVDQSIGVNIMLPFEQSANHVIEGDDKLVNLKYFFTRKLLFVKEVHAIAIFPGGFGTLDECFEVLTLVQTGKRDLMPIVLVSDPSDQYWTIWQNYVHKELLDTGLISPADTSLYRVCQNVDDAVEEVMRFYCVYHSMRYVKGDLVLRLQVEPSDEFVEELNQEFGELCETGKIVKTEADPVEANDPHLLHLPRLRLNFNRREMGRLRQMVDVINDRLGMEDCD
ncbi:LOG family protein [Rubinisphaera margarita]|uniref:LOG family protein n=1 Tax=Rubinisphaera margarita TaxID=2909586 RepID=UPI001EE8BB69|nr:TIGR00730 family Rossman fold protein [Rubinisphaera margarita]MCG6155243.1 TIGR00730 family Rossman fold protein [Rubinisphaera margarita]